MSNITLGATIIDFNVLGLTRLRIYIDRAAILEAKAVLQCYCVEKPGRKSTARTIRVANTGHVACESNTLSARPRMLL